MVHSLYDVHAIIAVVNSANLTDGLDGLLSGVSLIYSIAMGVNFFSILQKFSTAASLTNPVRCKPRRNALHERFLRLRSPAASAFLKSNNYPAKVFMGDTGSMALGGAMSAMVIYSRSPFLFLLMGVCIVASAVSVVLQRSARSNCATASACPFKWHLFITIFELLGYPETKSRFRDTYSDRTCLRCRTRTVPFDRAKQIRVCYIMQHNAALQNTPQ